MAHSAIAVRRFAAGCTSPNLFRFGFFVFVGVSIALFSNCAVASVDDSLPRYRLDSVVVTATRIPPSAPRFVAVREIPLASLIGEQSLSTALAPVSGLQVRNYGGAGALSTISFRGMDAAETVVLLDGVRINSLQNGLIDLNKIPLAGIETATLSTTNLSFDESPGGVLELRSAPMAERFTASANTTLGPFGETVAGAFVGGGNATLVGSAGFSYTHAVNDFPYIFNGLTFQRMNADFTMRSFQARGSWSPDAAIPSDPASTEAQHAGLHHDLLWVANEASQGDPGTISGTSGAARQHDRQVTGQLRSQWIDNPSTHIESSVAFNYADETYVDTTVSVGAATLESNSVMRSITVSGRGSFTTAHNQLMHTGLRETFSSGSGLSLLSASRNETQALLGPEEIWVPEEIFQTVRLIALGRWTNAYDHVDNRTSTSRDLMTLSVAASGVVQGLPGLTLRMFGGSSGRFPTFNDLYWNPGGNPALRTEHATTAEVGGRFDFLWKGSWSIDGAAYLIDATDKIVWQPVSGNIWSPENVRHVVSQGVTGAVNWSPASWISIHASEDFASHIRPDAEFIGDAAAGKQLPYVPQQTVSAACTISTIDHALTFDAALFYSSLRYSTSDNSSYLPSYSTLNIGITGRWQLSGITLQPSLRCTNVTNVSYQILDGYPLPLRAFRFTLSIQFHEQ